MADDSDMLEDKPSGGKKNILIFIILGVVLLAAGGAAGYFLFGSSEPAPMTEAEAEPEPIVSGPALYVTLPQPFIFNVTGDSRDRLVQVNVQLLVRGEANEELAKSHLPLIRSTLLSAFGAATVEQLRNPTGRMDLRANATQALQSAMSKVAGENVVERVLFTGFVMQ
ncbi:flagellar basal body-associated protein FliL [Thaumasiovibrio subtropicus]|uniref:flagellar basal body-associated protein FliL n=1 Tax=Thaumasiovibrio subtropicus TaxID=1891207 RepID=UPI000B36038A|nr:flagellar basal body-associated protein FliL [Thaumasiovibrio subtropicus]